MSKRPSVIGNLNLPTGASAPSAESATAPQPAPTARKARPDIVHTSVYLPKSVHQKLREIAFTTDQKIHDIIMEGIGEALKKYGHPDVDALRSKR